MKRKCGKTLHVFRPKFSTLHSQFSIKKRGDFLNINELSQYYRLTKWAEVLEDELTAIRLKAYSVPSVSGGSGHSGEVSDRTGDFAVAISEKEAELHRALTLAEDAKLRIFEYITEVAKTDKLVSSIMYWRFIKCEKWYRVAMHFGSFSPDGCRKAVMRYVGRS